MHLEGKVGQLWTQRSDQKPPI
ncbi:hypothetical protein QTP70_020378 [Hemibagrus guttatus]|uniref:Uncharacterized protein n=1 Tax=Hemibagrus guttatus TaxID=175788 RepID=A0AAE0PPE6_9TELE|nr:hypothetical protein QTP70_020378 [Hemibagrus guttatus]